MGGIEIGEYIVEWDDKKNKDNKKKHKISFEIAAEIFLDERRIEDYDESHSDDEDRIKTIGKVENILVVIYTERGERLRLISARHADKNEEDEYYGQYYY